jgi:acyl-CoA synthetase (AMP-forming)/AMP-acid ligase II
MAVSTRFLINFPLSPNLSITDTSREGAPTYDRNTIDRRINAIASGLTRLGFADNSRIAVIDYLTYNFVTFNAGMYRARHAIVPVNFKVSAEQVEYCIRDSGAVMVFCDPQFAHLVPSGMKFIEFDSEEFDKFLGDEEFVPTPPGDNYEEFENKDITLIYTSGTTGKPKGVINSYAHRFWQISRGVEKPSVKFDKLVTLAPAPLYHLAGINNVEQDMFFSFANETHLVLMPQFDTKKYIQYIQDYKVSRLRLVAPMMAMVLQQKELLENADFSHVRGIALNSSFAPKKMQDEIHKHFTRLKWLDNPYGLTETGPLFGTENPRRLPKPMLSVGYPLPGVSCRINSVGVLEAKGPSVLPSYHNRPELKDSFTDDGYFVTGDLFRVNYNGFYFYMGRADDMFKSGGEKIYPSEIETIIERHPSVALSTVVGVEDEIKGHKPYAFVELKTGHSATPEEIKQFAIDNVATYQIPRQVWILDSLPRTNIGKIDRKTLKTLAVDLLKENT